MSFQCQRPVFSCQGLELEKLFQYFRGNKRQEDLTVFIANLARSAIAKTIDSCSLDAAQRASTTHQAHQLYYCVLAHVLQKLNPLHEVTEGRFLRSVISDPDEAHRMLRVPDFHLGLLTCSLELVCAAIFQDHTPLSIPAKIGSENSMLTVWDAAGWFLDCFSHGARQDRPNMNASGLAYLKTIRRRCEEELVLADNSTFYEIVFTGGGSLYAGGTTTLVGAFIASLGHTAVQYTMKAAQSLAEYTISNLPVAAADFVLACAHLMDGVLLQRLDLLFGRHLGVLITCCIYGVAKVLGATLGFRSVVLLVSRMFPDSNSLGKAKGEAEQEQLITSMRAFYNTSFLNACDRLIRASAKAASSSSSTAAEGSLQVAVATNTKPRPTPATKQTAAGDARAIWVQHCTMQQATWVQSPLSFLKLYR